MYYYWNHALEGEEEQTEKKEKLKERGMQETF